MGNWDCLAHLSQVVHRDLINNLALAMETEY